MVPETGIILKDPLTLRREWEVDPLSVGGSRQPALFIELHLLLELGGHTICWVLLWPVHSVMGLQREMNPIADGMQYTQIY